MKKKFALALSMMAAASMAQAANISWNDGTADYTTAADWTGGVVPGPSDSAINDNGTNNSVRISVGNPDWFVNQIRAGNGAGDGAFTQNGQTVTLTGTNSGTSFLTPFRLGVAVNNTGLYNLNGGSINYSNGGFNVGELGTGILNISGGAIAGTGNFAANLGSAAIPNAVNATVGNGVSEGDFTWFEQGLYTPNGALGLPVAGTTIVSMSQADHSFNLPPTYIGNDDVMVESNVPNATITLTPAAQGTALSFLCMSGNGATVLSYVVHHANSTTETGTATIPDWFGPGTAAEVMTVGARVDALGINFQFPGPANGFTGNAPYIWSLDLPVTSSSAVTSIDFSWVSGGVANLFAVSSQTTAGGAFAPVAISGFNKDTIVEAGAVTRVSNSVTDYVNQTNGAVTVGGALLVGNVGNGVYNLIGGTADVANNISLGANGGNGTLNLAGGMFTERGGGTFRVGDSGTGVLNQTGGTLVTLNNEFWIAQSGTGNGTYNMSAGSLIVSNWLAIGREGGIGVLNISGGSILKQGGGNLTITHGTGASGTINQTGGSITIATGQVWIGEDTAAGTWNMSAGTANVGVVHMAQNGNATGTLNLSGGTMTAQEVTTGNTGGGSILNLNGGTLQASVDNANFLHDITVVNVSAGGAIIDSQNFNITIPEALPTLGDGSGGLTKNGTGTLWLTGVNSYSGPTVVNAGTLNVGTSTSVAGAYTIGNNATLGTTVQSANGQLNMASLSVSGSTTFNIDLSTFGNPVSAPINVSGTVTASGIVTINVADGLPQLGQFPLIKYGALSGAPTLVLGPLPTGVNATLVNNTANNSIDLNITGINLPRWDGQAGGNWDIGLTTNWVNSGTGLPTFYGDGNAVLFDDNAAGTTTVNLTTTVKPLNVTANNTNLTYSIVGSGKISGAASLTKKGTGTLSLLNTGGNDYTGPTMIANGTLAMTSLANGGSPSAIGASSASPTNLVFAGGKLSYSGSPVSINRGYSVTADASSLETVGNLTLSGVVRGPVGTTFNKTGLGQLTYTGISSSNVLSDFNTAGSTYLVRAGTVVLDGTAGGQINFCRNLNVGADAGVDPTVILTNTILNTLSLQLGNNATCTGTLILNGGSTMTVAANNFAVGFSTGVPSTGVMIQNPGSVIDSAAELWEGQGSSVGTYIMNGGLATFRNWLAVGRAGGVATLTMTGGVLNKGGNGNFLIGTSAGNNALTSIGTLNQSGGTITSTNEYWLGENALDIGTNNISGTAVLNWLNWVSIGRHGRGVVNFSGGTIMRTGGGSAIVVGDNVGGGGNGFFNQTGGTLTSDNELWVGQGGGAVGRYDLSAGSVTINNWVAIARGGAASGVLNMSGGSFTKTGNGGNHLLVGTGGPGTINQTGGTIMSVLSDTYVGDSTTGIWNLDGGSAILSGIHISQNGGVSGTINLDTNGTLSATEITTGNAGGTSTLNINNGTLVAGNGASSNFIHGVTAVNVQNGVAVVNSGTNNVNVNQALLAGAGGGALTKIGNGTLNLNGVNTYAGATVVSAGSLGGTGTIAGPVNVASGATLAPGASSIGTLTVNNSLTLSNSSTTFVEVSLDGGVTNNDQVTGLTGVTYAGTLVVKNVGTSGLVTGSVFKLFNSTPAGTGNFASVTILPAGSGTFNPATGEVTITSTGSVKLNPPTVSNGNLVLTGSGDPGTGYTVLSSTNIALPLVQWDTNATGTFSITGTSSNAIPLSATNHYFLLRQP